FCSGGRRSSLCGDCCGAAPRGGGWSSRRSAPSRSRCWGSQRSSSRAPSPRLVAADSTLTVIDYHAHTALSHDGRRGWTIADLAAWHAPQGFGASYVTDHNVVFNGGVDDPIRLLPGVEWSVYDQHVVALGAVAPLERGVYGRGTR